MRRSVEVKSEMVEVDELIRGCVTRRGDALVVDARPMEDGGVTIYYGDTIVSSGLNTMEAFITLAAMVKDGPKNVRIVMPVVSEQFTGHYLTGYRATK